MNSDSERYEEVLCRVMHDNAVYSGLMTYLSDLDNDVVGKLNVSPKSLLDEIRDSLIQRGRAIERKSIRAQIEFWREKSKRNDEGQA
jgi:adenine C2-methylase RlmN of 23S rRNA A2503 and tRNA A37